MNSSGIIQCTADDIELKISYQEDGATYLLQVKDTGFDDPARTDSRTEREKEQVLTLDEAQALMVLFVWDEGEIASEAYHILRTTFEGWPLNLRPIP